MITWMADSFLAPAHARSLDTAHASLFEALEADLLVPIVAHMDSRWHMKGEQRVPLPPLAVCALACVSKSVLAKLRLVRPAIRTGDFGQAHSGALHRRRNPGIQSVSDALAFEGRGTWQIGQLSSLSYTDVDNVSGLCGCRMLHTLQLSYCRKLTNVNGLGACRSLQALYVNKCALLEDVTGLCHSMLRVLELCGCPRLANIAPLGSCERLEHLSLNGCTALSDAGCLSTCVHLCSLDLAGCRGVNDVSALRECPLLRKLDIRGTAYTRLGLPVPHIPSLIERRGPGWQEFWEQGRTGKVVVMDGLRLVAR